MIRSGFIRETTCRDLGQADWTVATIRWLVPPPRLHPGQIPGDRISEISAELRAIGNTPPLDTAHPNTDPPKPARPLDRIRQLITDSGFDLQDTQRVRLGEANCVTNERPTPIRR